MIFRIVNNCPPRLEFAKNSNFKNVKLSLLESYSDSKELDKYMPKLLASEHI